MDSNGDVLPGGDRTPPPPEEAGLKDTVLAYPGEITWVVARFEDYTGLFPYHCHVLEHEDHEMMRQFQVVAPLRVEKQTLPVGHTKEFTFSGAVSGTLSDGEILESGAVSPGSHTVTEAVPANWELRSIVCDDADSTGSIGSATATYEIAEGESVTCTFTNCILQLDLASRTVIGTETQVACDEIIAGNGFEVSSTGVLTLRARNRVVLSDGFSVADGGTLRVEADPDL